MRCTLLAALACLLFIPATVCPAPNIIELRTFTAAGNGSYAIEIGRGLAYHKISWNVSNGTVSACSVKLQQSADASSWSDLIAAQDCTTNGVSAITNAVANYVRVSVTTLTIATGTPLLSVQAAHYIDEPLASLEEADAMLVAMEVRK